MAASSDSQYQQLLAMNQQPLIHNTEPTLCQFCDKPICPGSGVVLANCLHSFCVDCLKTSLLEAITVQCPFPNGTYECVGNLEHREIEALLSSEECHDFMDRQLEALQEGTPEEVVNQLELLNIATEASVIPNAESFECPICMDPCEAYKGVIFNECFHCLCRECLVKLINLAEDVDVKCPIKDNDKSCDSVVQHSEIKSLLSAEEYNAYLERSLKKAELSADNAFHCKTPDCAGWCLVEDNVTAFHCSVCQAHNCVQCEASHAGLTCQAFKDQKDLETMDKLSKEQLEQMISTGKAMRCPKCRIALTKIAGCDAIICSICKTHVCWATRGPRWGPRGPGDTSGGCRCKVNGMRCHPNCQNCH